MFGFELLLGCSTAQRLSAGFGQQSVSADYREKPIATIERIFLSISVFLSK
jgi:hypothetical protein